MDSAPIRILGDDVINQIAAGEVVERPSSVVKELIENALDAGATHISVEVSGGGVERISVTDNGVGMTEAQAELGLRRHATSKLIRVDDLLKLDTFGFRGEALPSIASVSKMMVTTRCQSDESAIRFWIEGGTIVKRRHVGAPIGTHIEVNELLFNVPARRKFLKAESTETSHVHSVVLQASLAHPNVHIRLQNRKRTTLSAPMHSETHERVRSVMGAKLGHDSIVAKDTIAGVQVEAYLGHPSKAQSNARGVQLFARRRPVRDRGLLGALSQGYGEHLPKGRYPVAVLFVDVPNAEIDINVHPQKMEVRFADNQRVFAAVRHVVRDAIESASWNHENDSIRRVASMPLAVRGSYIVSDLAERHSAKILGGLPKHKSNMNKVSPQIGPANSVERPSSNERGDSNKRTRPTWKTMKQSVEPGPIGPLRYIDHFDEAFYVMEANGRWLFVEKKIANTCLRMTRLLNILNGSSPLLIPVEIASNQRELSEEHASKLSSLGFEIKGQGELIRCSSTAAGYPLECVMEFVGGALCLQPAATLDDFAWLGAKIWEKHCPSEDLLGQAVARWASEVAHWNTLKKRKGVTILSVDEITERMKRS